MPTPVSPSVTILEQDMTNIAIALATTAGAFGGTFQWGPVLEVRNIASEPQLVSTFGKPTNATATSFFTAANFLSYGSNLNVVRNVGPLAKNATASGVGLLIPNKADYEHNYAYGSVNTAGNFAAKYPGTLGNGLQVFLADANIYNGLYVSKATVLTGGVGYATAPTVAISGNGTGATAVAVLGTGTLSDKVVAINITNSGTGYTTATIALSGGTPTTAATASVSLASASGGWPYKSLFAVSPGTSDFVANLGGSNDELHAVVVDGSGAFTGIAGTVLESFPFLSKASDALDYSSVSKYFANFISRASRYVYWMGNPSDTASNIGSLGAGTVFGNLSNFTPSVLAGGVSDDTLVDSVVQGAFAMFSNAEAIDISLIPLGGVSTVTANYVIQNIVLKRLDCMAFVSPLLSDVLNNVGSEVTSILTTRNALQSTSYAVMDSGWKYQFDRYNNVYRWVPLCGDTAGLCARTDETNNPWWSPAGVNRGQVNNVVKLAFSPEKADRDVLYPMGVNPVVSLKGLGVVLYGDRTLLSKPSAFDRINVRRLFIVVEKTIATASKFFLFEFNDALTRSQFVSTVTPFLANIQGLRGITAFSVQCDDNNNTPQVIDSNTLVGTIKIAPTRSINFIELNFQATATGVTFSTTGQ